jgi:hypothetical protein
MNEIRIAVTGGREMMDAKLVAKVLGRLAGRNVILAHGACTGADQLCKEFAIKMGWKVVPYEADWKGLGNAAGPIRNAWLLDDFKPDYLIVFPGGRGTLNMVNKALDRKIRIVYSSKLSCQFNV